MGSRYYYFFQLALSFIVLQAFQKFTGLYLNFVNIAYSTIHRKIRLVLTYVILTDPVTYACV